MERGWWDAPVPVLLGSGFTVHHVNNNHQAADILLNRWPAQGGAKHRAARQAVLSAYGAGSRSDAAGEGTQGVL
ncbi:DUF982 domain-containing protein [Mesorhizobium sp. IMUNJ 23232]|uniref:DUF982 domain-containing protein n=1 Tax=Mesorhizobium sp. IMUNJ 23232 TaxID=3376064 RepID=UPI0037BAA10F